MSTPRNCRPVAGQTRRRTSGDEAKSSRAPLTGRIFDAAGERMSPTFAIGARGKRYRYYVSTSFQKGRRRPDDRILRRAPAGGVEQAVAERMRRIDGVDAAMPFAMLHRVEVHADRIVLDLPAALRRTLQASLARGEEIAEHPRESDRLRLTLPFAIPRRGGGAAVGPGTQPGPQPDPFSSAPCARRMRCWSGTRPGGPGSAQ